MVSIIIPVYNERDNLISLQADLDAVMLSIGPCEVIYVDDCSTDGSRGVLGEILATHSQVRVIEFARHFGQTEAMQAGIDHSSGDVLVFLDADLQNDPKDIPRLLARLDEGCDVVSGWRRKRQDQILLRTLPSLLANGLISRVTGVFLHDIGCTLKAFRRKVLDRYRLYGEMHRLMVVYAARQGAVVTELEVNHRRRLSGRSKYGLSRVFRLLMDFLVAEFLHNYLNKPMYVFGGWGMALLLTSFFLGVMIVVRKLFFVGEWVSPLLFIFVVTAIIGVQCILMGLIAEIMIRVYYEKRTIYVLKK